MLHNYGIETSPNVSSLDNMEWESSETPSYEVEENNAKYDEDDFSTIRLSCPSQKIVLSQEEAPLFLQNAETKEECCQTKNSIGKSVILGIDDYPHLLKDASKQYSLQDEIRNIQ